MRYSHSPLKAALLGIFLSLTLCTFAGAQMVGDLDGDGNVDIDDLNIILAAIGTKPPMPDPRDLDGDGQITVLDARKLVLLCTFLRCARFDPATFYATADCSPTEGLAPLTVNFQTFAVFTGGSIVRYRWDFEGDGFFDTDDPVAADYDHTFTQSDTYEAVLEVTNNIGDVTTDSCTIEVQPSPPTATASASPSNGPVPLDVGLSCTGNDPDGFIVLFEWDFEGNGTFDFSSPTSGDTTHVYTKEGTFTAVCRVTDDDGLTAEAPTNETVVRVGPPGSPSVEAIADVTAGDAPLSVNFDGTATDDGKIFLWEWDFEGDGTFDFSSPKSPITSFTYADIGTFVPVLRVTDNDDLTAFDTIAIEASLVATLSVPDDTFDPTVGETVNIDTTISAAIDLRLFLRDSEGNVVRTLVDESRAAGSYSDPWDGRDDGGELLTQAVYFAILEYEAAGGIASLDLTDTTGGIRYNPSRGGFPNTFSPFEDDLLTVNFTIPSSRGASDVEAFIGLFNVDTRFITLVNREPFGVGGHTIYWDGFTPAGDFAEPPPGDSFLFGIFGYTLPDNAIMLQSAPVLSDVSVEPNIFDPATPDFLTPDDPVAVVTYSLDKTADVELTVTNLTTGVVVRQTLEPMVTGGTGHTIEWDGKADNSLFVDKGDYRLTLRASDSTGSVSINRFALVRVFY